MSTRNIFFDKKNDTIFFYTFISDHIVELWESQIFSVNISLPYRARLIFTQRGNHLVFLYHPLFFYFHRKNRETDY